MTVISSVNADTLPALARLEAIDRRAKKVESVCMLEHSRDGVSDVEYLRQLEGVVPDLPNFQSEMTSIGLLAGRRQLADWLSIMRAAFPTSKIPDTFCGLLVERVAAHRPTLAALDWSVREVVDRAQFFPSAVATFLQLLEASQARYDRTLRMSEALPAKRDELAAAVAQQERDQAQRAAAAAALRQACLDILGSGSRQAFDDMVRSGDDALKARVRARRDELLLQPRSIITTTEHHR